MSPTGTNSLETDLQVVWVGTLPPTLKTLRRDPGGRVSNGPQRSLPGNAV